MIQKLEKTSNIDLSLCSPDLVADSIWSTISDPHHPDHYPISIKIDFPTTQSLPEHFNLKIGDWENFRIECSQKLYNSHNIDITEFNNTLISISENHIPKISTKPRKNKLWFNDNCK